MYHLAKNPEKQERLHNELCQHMSSKDELLTSQKLDAMKYLKACMKEALRLVYMRHINDSKNM
jgi:cytochrome P450